MEKENRHLNELETPITTYLQLLEFMKEKKIDPRDLAMACKIYESIYVEQSKYFNLIDLEQYIPVSK